MSETLRKAVYTPWRLQKMQNLVPQQGKRDEECPADQRSHVTFSSKESSDIATQRKVIDFMNSKGKQGFPSYGRFLYWLASLGLQPSCHDHMMDGTLGLALYPY